MSDSRSHKFKIAKSQDRQIWDWIQALIKENNWNSRKFTYTALGNTREMLPDKSQNNSNFFRIIELGSDAIEKFQFEFDTFRIVFSRNVDQPYDELTLNYSLDQVSEPIFIITAIKRKFSVINTVFSRNQQPDYSDANIALREAELNRLQSMVETLVEKQTEFFRQKEDDFREREIQLQNEIQKEKEIQQGKFDAQQSELDKKEKELDISQSKDARRKIRTELKAIFKNRAETFTLTAGTKKLRLPIHITFVGLIVVLGFGAGYYTYTTTDILQAQTVSLDVLLALTLKSLVVTLGFGSAVYYYIQWANRWFEQHADEEFHLKRLEIDFDRASWVVEMALEWKQEMKEDIPPHLLEKLTENLFQQEAPQELKLHPADQLASALLGSASNATIKLPGGSGELMFDRKGISKMNNSTE